MTKMGEKIFSKGDVEQIEKHGLSVQQVERQVENFERGFPFLDITRAARVGDGIIMMNEAELSRAIERYRSKAKGLRVVKFVPASGAATRMFKELFEFVNEGKRGAGIDVLLKNIDKFAFWKELKSLLPEGATEQQIVSAIVMKEGLGYGAQPKALVDFHSYDGGVRKALEEHLVEGALYGAEDGVSRIHFTVSPEHLEGFQRRIESVRAEYEAKFGVRYEISFSMQKASTDTIAVNPDNAPFRDAEGRLLFRPAGHGALIENVAEIDADVIFIKTIDNVTTDALRGDTVRYKMALAGVMLELQERCFGYIKEMDEGRAVHSEVLSFISKGLQIAIPEGVEVSMNEAREILDRPIRVCGMVRNEGEPGGGPFWVRNSDATESLQIAESSQIAPEKMGLMQNATHFNPVDIVCGVRDDNGELYELRKYVDPTTGFISEKSSGGRPLRAQELPGLWNGAMARWNTIFVEVPISTFTPVKVVQDLLRSQHQM